MSVNKNEADFRGMLGSRPSMMDRGLENENREQTNVRQPAQLLNKISVEIYNSHTLGLELDGAKHAYHPNDEGVDFNANGGISPGEAVKNEFRSKRGYGIAKYKAPEKDFNRGYLQPNGFFISQTALGFRHLSESNPEKWVDAVTVPYLRINRHFKRLGVNLGDIAYIINQSNGLSSYAIFADVKYGNDVTEMSLALAQKLEIPVIQKTVHSYDRSKLVTKYWKIEDRPVIIYSFIKSGDGYAKTLEQINTLGEFLKSKFLFKEQNFYPFGAGERLS